MYSDAPFYHRGYGLSSFTAVTYDFQYKKIRFQDQIQQNGSSLQVVDKNKYKHYISVDEFSYYDREFDVFPARINI